MGPIFYSSFLILFGAMEWKNIKIKEIWAICSGELPDLEYTLRISHQNPNSHLNINLETPTLNSQHLKHTYYLGIDITNDLRWGIPVHINII